MTDERVPTQGMLIHSRHDWPCVLCRPHAWAGTGDMLLCVECATNLVVESIQKVQRSIGSDEDFKTEISGPGEASGRTKRRIPPGQEDH